MAGRWKVNGTEVSLQNDPGPSKCDGAATYRFTVDASGVGFELIADECKTRQMILDHSRWTLPGTIASAPTRRIVRTAGIASTPLPKATTGVGDWPSFRGREASGVSDKQNLPDTWNPTTGENILWRTPNCYITPHLAGGQLDERGHQVRHFLDNLQRFTSGQPLTDRIW